MATTDDPKSKLGGLAWFPNRAFGKAIDLAGGMIGKTRIAIALKTVLGIGDPEGDPFIPPRPKKKSATPDDPVRTADPGPEKPPDAR